MFRRSIYCVAWTCLAAGPAFAQNTAPATPATPAPSTATPATPAPPAVNKLAISDLETMLGPVALYPDTLLANVLAGSVYPLEIVKVQRYMTGGGTVEQLAKDGIEPPVQALAKVPDVLKMMSDNLEWTEALGQAYLAQSQDVMTAVQNLRGKAKSNGILQSGQQQTVVEQGDTIIIQSAQPEVIYVPSYDPAVVYVDHYDGGDAVAAGIIGFGVGLTVGAIWANNMDCHWHSGCVGWGHGDVDVDVDIDNNFNRNTNINRNDIKNNNVGRNRAGQQGQPFKPNAAKATNLSKPGGTSQMDKFRGTGAKGPGQVPSNVKMPNPKRDTPAARPSTGGPSTPSRAASPGNTAVRPSTPSRPSTPAKPAAPAARPSAPASPARPSPAPSRPTPQAPAAAQRSSGYNTSRATPAQSSRGATSRASSGASRGGGGASRGGGSRGGGGRR